MYLIICKAYYQIHPNNEVFFHIMRTPFKRVPVVKTNNLFSAKQLLLF